MLFSGSYYIQQARNPDRFNATPINMKLNPPQRQIITKLRPAPFHGPMAICRLSSYRGPYRAPRLKIKDQ